MHGRYAAENNKLAHSEGNPARCAIPASAVVDANLAHARILEPLQQGHRVCAGVTAQVGDLRWGQAAISQGHAATKRGRAAIVWGQATTRRAYANTPAQANPGRMWLLEATTCHGEPLCTKR